MGQRRSGAFRRRRVAESSYRTGVVVPTFRQRRQWRSGLVSPRRLDKDPEYQREFDQGWAQKIAGNWDNSRCRPINVRLRDGNLYITNGQHTAEAAHLAGVEEVLVVINNGSPSRQKEARE